MGGYWLPFVISLSWSTLVGMLGYSEERVWNSFFLQYLWEFCLGMKLAEVYVKRSSALDVPKWKFLLPACAIGMLLAGLAGWAGFPWRLYNDIPSLVGYATLALMIYKTGIGFVNRVFIYTNKFSYEWYLVHILVFQIVNRFTAGFLPVMVEGFLCFSLSYLLAYAYSLLWRHKKKQSIVNKC